MHKQPGKAAAPDNLAEQVRDLQAKVAKLETALKPKHHGTPDTREMGGMEGMKPEEMMKMMMCGTKPGELYPSLMSLPELSPEKRDEVQQQANERMKAGIALMSQGLERLSKAAGDDYGAMQKGTEQMREGLALFESGLAAQRALAAGWLMRSRSRPPPGGSSAPSTARNSPIRNVARSARAIDLCKRLKTPGQRPRQES
jgi:hypothetical protein